MSNYFEEMQKAREEKEQWLQNLQAGDEVGVSHYSSFAVSKVTATTKNFIEVGEDRYRFHGWHTCNKG